MLPLYNSSFYKHIPGSTLFWTTFKIKKERSSDFVVSCGVNSLPVIRCTEHFLQRYSDITQQIWQEMNWQSFQAKVLSV